MSPLASIVVICYNQGQYLEEAVRSVQVQKYPNWELIIVDDGSTDVTQILGQRLADESSRVSYYRIENSGPSNARNYGIGLSEGEYVLPLDADDRISENYISQGIAHFELFPETKVVYAKAEKFGTEHGAWQLRDYRFETLLLHNMIYCSAIFRREDFQTSCGYDVSLRHGYEDWEFWIAFLGPDSIVHCLPDVHFYYRVKTSSRNVDFKLSDSTVNATFSYIYRKHYEKYDRAFGNPIVAFRKLKALQDFQLGKEGNIFSRSLLHLAKRIFKSLGGGSVS